MSDAGAVGEPVDQRRGRLLHVTTAQFLGSLAAALVVFFVASGPLWKHAEDIGRLDSAIYWSYGVIPLLVAMCLVASKHWSLKGFLLDTMALGVTKYVVTASIAIALWAIHGDPPSVTGGVPHVATSAGALALGAPGEPRPTPTPIDPAKSGEIELTVTRDGAALEGAIVYVSGGLDGMVFAVPQQPLLLENDGHGVTPSFAVAETGQVIEARSRDGQLHTLVVRRGGAALFNIPLLSSGAPTLKQIPDVPGIATVRCNVHGAAETETHLVLVSSPYHARTDGRGHAHLTSVPAGKLRVAAAASDGAALLFDEASVELAARAEAKVSLTLHVP